MNADKLNNIVSTFVSKQCNEITESQQGFLQVDNSSGVSRPSSEVMFTYR